MPVVSDLRHAASLARIADEIAGEWGLELGTPFALSRFSYVVPAGRDAVLKITPADDDESDEEADALGHWSGAGAPRLLRHDRARRALLIERARPGTDISRLADEDATGIAVGLGRRLWRPAGAPFRWIGDHVPVWLEQAERSATEARRALLPVARRLYGELDVRRVTLVHGDLHHHNILDAGDRHLAIDPKPMLGEPEFDVPSFLWNPLGTGMTRRRTERRLAAFAAAGLDPERMRAWAVIRGAYLIHDRAEAQVLRALV